ncbi:MAG: hypothetical protein N2645_22590 [Clostridia bacterium]|nr:hypothetical protein [Clostridia bacterium]
MANGAADQLRIVKKKNILTKKGYGGTFWCGLWSTYPAFVIIV